MLETRRSPLIRMLRIATLVALGDLVTKQIALLWIGALEPRVASAIQFGVVHNDKGAFGLTAGDYTFELSLALTLAALVLIVPVTRDLARIDGRAPTALGLIAGGATGNLVSLLLSPAGVVDFIAIQRADGAGIVLNVADLGAYAGVIILMRTTAMVIKEIRHKREKPVQDVDVVRSATLTRLADLELVRVVAREDGRADPSVQPETGAPVNTPRPISDRQVNLRVVHADSPPPRPGRVLSARLRDHDAATGRLVGGSAYLRPMSHMPESRRSR